ncbi:hypothetical protein [Streptomyces sp. NPDC096324]|uniref:hypothetical protein n=1 Tax=Streptomyces sp. NPDC096324 TaxID=3366085 RepID=UPI003819A786
MRRIARGSHEIGDHAWRHAVTAVVSDAQIRDELRRSAQARSRPSPVSPAVSRRWCARPGAAPTTDCVVNAQQWFHPGMFRPHRKRPCPGQPGQGLSQSAGQALHLHFPAGSGASFLGPPTHRRPARRPPFSSRSIVAARRAGLQTCGNMRRRRGALRP